MPTSNASNSDKGAEELIDELTRAWSAGDATAFGRPFSRSAIFVAFDGTVLRGPEAIANYHSGAFSTHLANTRLEVNVEETRTIAPDVMFILTRGGIRRGAESSGPLIGPSIQTFVIREEDGRFLIESFQNTRDRPITSPAEGLAWRDFDLAWGRLSEKAAR